MDEIKDAETIAKIKDFWVYCDSKMRSGRPSQNSYIFASRARQIMNVFGTRDTADRMFRNASETSKEYQTALKLLTGTAQDAVYGKNRYLLQK